MSAFCRKKKLGNLIFSILHVRKMSSANKSNSSEKRFYCDVCKIKISTEAEYALHEFSKKHCDNLLRIAKNKPIISKQKGAKPEGPIVNKEESKITAPAPGNIAKYGYFVPGEVYDTKIESKEFDTDYDPYDQKYAGNPLKEIVPPAVSKPSEGSSLEVSKVAGFARKKRKKIRACQICNVSMLTVPEYEAHMRSPQHSWKLKMSGMGVSAHFVKASTDLHTIEMKEDDTLSCANYSSDSKDDTSLEGSLSSDQAKVFPTLYCDICELLLNSEQQYNAHVNGKSHNESVQRKAENKAKRLRLEAPGPNQLYCYSCKVALNNLYQYNEHKFGKRHKTRCRKLMKEGITIPPEERISSWGLPKMDPRKPVVYPEMYEKCISETQKTTDSCPDVILNVQGESGSAEGSGSAPHETRVESYKSAVGSESAAGSEEPANSRVCLRRVPTQGSEPSASDSSPKNESSSECVPPRMVFHRGKDPADGATAERYPLRSDASEPASPQGIDGENESVGIECRICRETFSERPRFELHLSGEEHARKVVEERGTGIGDDALLEVLMTDRACARADGRGSHFCGICCISAGNLAEYRNHLSTAVHKRSEEEYRRKRRTEIEFAIYPDAGKHRDEVNAGKAEEPAASKRALILQQRRLKHKYMISGLKRKDFACWRRNCERNPGVRTKIAGMARDLRTGCEADVPNLETLEPNIDSSLNVRIGASAENEEPTTDPVKRTRRKKRGKLRSGDSRRPAIRSLLSLPVENPFAVHPSAEPSTHPRFVPPGGDWAPYRQSYNFRSNALPLLGLHPSNRYRSAPNFLPSWSRYPPCYR